ncbi:MAG: ABC transporter permease [Gemmatimonadetes bacterium]|nr:ABC transporter permease [Gemmatimonadota bacterium]
MRQLPIIFRREFIERVRSRSFILSTVLTPVFLSLFAVGPALTGRIRSGGSDQISVLDESGSVGARTVELINQGPPGDTPLIAGEALSLGAGSSSDGLADLVADGTIDAYLRIPADVMTSNLVELHVDGGFPGSARARVVAAVSTAVQIARLRAVGIPESELSSLFRPVAVQTVQVARPAPAPDDGEAAFVMSLLVGFLLYFLILLYGAQVMHSVQEEKTSRIAEVLVSSVTPSDLMLGKVLGVGATALAQVTIWAVFARFVLGARESLARMGIPGMVFEILSSDVALWVAISSLGYLVLGFFLYATLFAAVGAAAASTEDAQRFTFPLILPLFIPMFFAEVIVSDPTGTTATALSWVPLTAPLVVPMRMGGRGVAAWEIGATLLMLALSVVAAAWVAGKIYRVGILSTGTRPTLGELVRWLRMA